MYAVRIESKGTGKVDLVATGESVQQLQPIAKRLRDDLDYVSEKVKMFMRGEMHESKMHRYIQDFEHSHGINWSTFADGRVSIVEITVREEVER